MTRKQGILLGAALIGIGLIGAALGRWVGRPLPERQRSEVVGEAHPPGTVPASDASNALALEQAQKLAQQGELLEAKRLYQQILQQAVQQEVASQALEALGEVNVALLLSKGSTPDAFLYTVEPGDTLTKIAAKHSATVELIQAANGLQSDLIRVGQPLKVTKTQFTVLVDKSQNTLTLKNREEVLKVYRCSTGEGGITPAGEFKITNRLVDPAWKGVIPPGDPDNPLGSRWLGFDLPEYGIHGTDEPETIGKPVTAGCVRLTNKDVEELYTLLPIGTKVTIVE